MIIQSFKNDEKENDDISLKTMFVLAIATSIDALAVGVSFAFLKIDITIAAICIGIITFILSLIGVKLGNVFGEKYKQKAEITGGIILIFIAFKMILEHYMV